MFPANTYIQRRKKLHTQVDSGLLLVMGNDDVGMNYKANTYHFRQDSNFLYFFGIDKQGFAGVIDLDEGTETVFGNDFTIDDVVWMGPQPSVKELASQVGIEKTASYSKLEDVLKKAKSAGRKIHYLPPYRYENMYKLNQWLDIPISELKANASEEFIKAVVAQRSYKSPEEIIELHTACTISGAMHFAAMHAAAVGKTEANIVGIVEGIASSAGCSLAYPVILSKDGQTLHNHYHGNIFKEGDLILGDFGAATAKHYAGDLTRTYPAGKTFTDRQKDIYNIVLRMQTYSLSALKPGVKYKDVHLLAAEKMTDGLKELGLMKGDSKEAVAAGAHALFFPHGLGHMMGLDVHDMEDLGEDYVGYSDTVKRSDQFGTAYLRLGRELEQGFVLTVEPGCYFIPELIDKWKAEKKFTDFINYDKVESYKDFGGVRIEDDVLITDRGSSILGKPVPKIVEDIEGIRKGGNDPSQN